MYSLILETCTKRAIVALVHDDHLKYCAALPFGYSHSRYLLTKIDEGLRGLNIEPKNLDRIITGVGPGSYTGIRVGAAVAKTMSYANKTPLIGISTLYTFAPTLDGVYAALIDAKMGGAYFVTGTKKGSHIENLSEPQIFSLEEIGEKLGDAEYLVCPDGCRLKEELSKLYPDNNWKWEESTPDPMIMNDLANPKFDTNDYTTDGYLDLIYLK